jgi:TM2 domain-containing membrane protein YozV
MKEIFKAIGSLLGFIIGGILILALGLIISALIIAFMPGLVWAAVSFLLTVGVVAIFTKDD